nr:DUF5065 family protein [Bacillus toyonensis]
MKKAAATYEEPYSDPYHDNLGFDAQSNFSYLPIFPNAHMIKGSYRTGDIFHYPLNSIEDGAGAVMKIFELPPLSLRLEEGDS